MARLVAFAGLLDLDDLGAQIAQDLRRPGRRQHARQIEHADMGKGAQFKPPADSPMKWANAMVLSAARQMVTVMERAIGAGAIVLVAMVAGTADAASIKCAKPPEVSAIQAAAIQQELMVAALTCNDVTNFNAFQTNFSSELRTSDNTLLGMFHRLYGYRKGEVEYHAFKTRLANDSSMRSIHDNPNYCKEASIVFSSALAPEKPRLADFVAGVQVTDDDSPIDSCEIRVETGLKGAAIPTIVPQPNPVRVAQLATDPAASAPPTPMTPAAAPQAPAPDAAAPDAEAPDGPMPPADADAPPPPDQNTGMQAPEPGVLPDPDQPLPSPSAKADAPASPPDDKQDDTKSDSGGWLSGITSSIGDLF